MPLDLIAPLADLRKLSVSPAVFAKLLLDRLEREEALEAAKAKEKGVQRVHTADEQRVADRKGGFEVVNIGGTGDRSPPTTEVEHLADFATESARGEGRLEKDRAVPIEAIDVRSASPW